MYACLGKGGFLPVRFRRPFRRLKHGLVVLAALPLLGCLADLRQQLAKCISDAEREHRSETWLVENAGQNYVWLCMAAHGYRLNGRQSNCPQPVLPITDAVLYAECYEPTARMSRLIQKVET